MTKGEIRWLTRCPGCDAELPDLDALRARVAELEAQIYSGFKGWSEGGVYAEVLIDADFFETLKPQP